MPPDVGPAGGGAAWLVIRWVSTARWSRCKPFSSRSPTSACSAENGSPPQNSLTSTSNDRSRARCLGQRDHLRGIEVVDSHRGRGAALGCTSSAVSSMVSRSASAASTLVQRFGTKAGLLRAALARAWDSLDARRRSSPAGADRRRGRGRPTVRLNCGRPRRRLRRSAPHSSRGPPRPRVAGQGARLDRDARRRHRATAQAAPGGGRGLGTLVVSHWQGTLTVWSFVRDTSLTGAVRTSLGLLLARLGVDPTIGPGQGGPAAGR